MTGPTNTSEPPRIRLVFQLERAELPRLYDAVSYTHLTLPTNREV